MKASTVHSAKIRRAAIDPQFPPLEQINRPTVPTEQAGYYLDRRPQTMRIWAMREDGPLRPLRINGRLAWQVSDLKRILRVA